jgi:diguanylate cyclase (GGDEF)-like protein/PAS domain S-box-containing protein
MVPSMTESKRKAKPRADNVRENEELVKRYEFLLHHTRDIIFVVRCRDRKILDANAAALIAYQYTIKELKSMTIDDLGPAELQAQDNPPLDTAVARVMLFETIHIRKNGETFPVEVSSQQTMMGNDRILLSVIRDLSGRKQSQEAMRESESNMRALLNAVTETLLLLAKDGTVLAANETSARRLRVGIDKIIGANYYDLLPADTAKERRKQADNVVQNGMPVRFEDIRDKRYFDQVIYPVCDGNGKVARLAFFGADITRHHEMEQELEAMALTDQLTGLYNRRGFFTLATRELRRAERSKNGMLLFFADLDGLKAINDQFGHEEGDRVLTAAAKLLTQTFRVSDILSRVGGDEFAILVVDSEEGLVEKLLLRLYRLMNKLNARKASKFKLTMSIGHAVYDPLAPLTLDELISNADRQMYKMKKVRYRRP